MTFLPNNFKLKIVWQANLPLSIHLRVNVKLVFGELALLNFINELALSNYQALFWMLSLLTNIQTV